MAGDYVPEDGPKVPFGIFTNSYKQRDSHPDYKSDFTITDTLLRQVLALRQQGKMAVIGLAGWRKTTKNGDPFISAQIQVDTFRTAKRYECEESDIRAIIEGVDNGGAASAPAAAPAAPDPFLGAPAPQASSPAPSSNSDDPFMGSPGNPGSSGDDGIDPDLGF